MPAGSNAYNSLWQVRTDAWSTPEESTAQLTLAGGQQRPVEQLAATTAGALEVLAPIERFWAFPGMQAFYKVRQLFATGKYDRCATLVARINRTLATDSYRGGHLDADPEDDGYDHEPSQADQASARLERPYFEVLVVEDMTEDQEHALREELRRWRRPDDQFVYEIVVVPSFDDAVMAARLNFRLQACVVRRRFAHRSRHDASSLRQFVSLLGSDNLMDRPPDERAQLLARAPAPLPDFSGFHPSFTDGRGLPTREGDVRRAFAASARPAPPPDLAGPAPASAAADAVPSTSPDAP